MSYTIKIQAPCHEDWNNMKPTQQGAFCKSCSKEVVDYTHTSKSELARKIGAGQNICGRFKPEQLNTPLPSLKQSDWKRNALALGFTSILAISAPALGQSNLQSVTPPTNIKPVPQHVVGRINVQPVQVPIKTSIKGVVTDGFNPLTNAVVQLKGTDINAKTDKYGAFCISLDDALIDLAQLLVISHENFKQQEVSVVNKTQDLNIALNPYEDIMGEIMIIEEHEPGLIEKTSNLFKRKK